MQNSKEQLKTYKEAPLLPNMSMVCSTKSFPVIAQLSATFVWLPETFISENFNIHTLTHTITLSNNHSKSCKLNDTNGYEFWRTLLAYVMDILIL